MEVSYKFPLNQSNEYIDIFNKPWLIGELDRRRCDVTKTHGNCEGSHFKICLCFRLVNDVVVQNMLLYQSKYHMYIQFSTMS